LVGGNVMLRYVLLFFFVTFKARWRGFKVGWDMGNILPLKNYEKIFGFIASNVRKKG
jgi:hypothetical protein